MDVMADIRQQLREQQEADARRGRLWDDAIAAAVAALTPVQRAALTRTAGTDDHAPMLDALMRQRPAPERVARWWAASHEAARLRVEALTVDDPERASHAVGAAVYALHAAGADLTEPAVVDLARAALTYQDGLVAGRLEHARV